MKNDGLTMKNDGLTMKNDGLTWCLTMKNDGLLWFWWDDVMWCIGIYVHYSYFIVTIMILSVIAIFFVIINQPLSQSSGWWFGTWIFLFHILGLSSSQLTFIFFRGVETTNQSAIWVAFHMTQVTFSTRLVQKENPDFRLPFGSRLADS